MKNIIVGLFGQAASGKDTVAGMLAPRLWQYIDHEKPLVTKIAFAYNVKKIYCDYFDVDFDFIEEWKRNPEPPPGFSMNVRQALQMIGDGFRKVKNSVWIDKVLNKMQNVIITDGRYLNEAKAIKEKDGIVILIDRPSHRNADQNDSEKIMGEASDYFGNKDANGIIADSNYPMFDYYIKNDSNLLTTLML
jgi:uridine kinase